MAKPKTQSQKIDAIFKVVGKIAPMERTLDATFEAVGTLAEGMTSMRADMSTLMKAVSQNTEHLVAIQTDIKFIHAELRDIRKSRKRSTMPSSASRR